MVSCCNINTSTNLTILSQPFPLFPRDRYVPSQFWSALHKSFSTLKYEKIITSFPDQARLCAGVRYLDFKDSPITYTFQLIKPNIKNNALITSFEEGNKKPRLPFAPNFRTDDKLKHLAQYEIRKIHKVLSSACLNYFWTLLTPARSGSLSWFLQKSPP